MTKKFISRVIRFRFAWVIVSFLVFSLAVRQLLADETPREPIVPPHPGLGIADINTGLEAAHTPPAPAGVDVAYRFLDSNYQQAQNLGATWNRWKIDWHAVEITRTVNQTTVIEVSWACRNHDCLPPDLQGPNNGAGKWFDYPRLFQEDEARGIKSLVVLDEVPKFYKPGGSHNTTGHLIEGIFTSTFQTMSGTTDDPNNPDIDPNNPMNPNNKWASFFYSATRISESSGIRHWQIMNEMNKDLFWVVPDDPVLGPQTYVRLLQVANKIIQYDGLPDQIISGGLVYGWANINGRQEQCFADNAGMLNDWAEQMLCELTKLMVADPAFTVEALALHPYERSKTSYDFPTSVSEHVAEPVFVGQEPMLAGIPVWLTETGSSGCAGEAFAIVGPNGTVNCPPVKGQSQARSTDAEQANYIIQSLAYAFTVPQVDTYFQFHLHDFCPQGQQDASSVWYRPGFGLYHNWPGYDFFVGGEGSNCAVTPYDGREKPSYQASRWLRDLRGYTSGGVGDPWVEFLTFPSGPSSSRNVTHVTWSRHESAQRISFPPAETRSGGPILAQYPDGSQRVIALDSWFKRYRVPLEPPTNPIIETEGGDPEMQRPIIGGEPVILLEHLLFDLGAAPSVLPASSSGHEAEVAISFGLNLPVRITQGVIHLDIFSETGALVHSQAASFANGVHSFYWNGTDWSGALVAPGLYTYQIAMPSQGYNVTGVVGVSQPGVLACYFQEAAFQLPDNLFRDFVTSAPIVGGKLSFTYTSAPPVPELVDNDYWSARYAAYLRVQTPGMYRFGLAELDDVARLFVDGVLVSMSEWQVQAGARKDISPGIYLTAGLHPVLIEYEQAVGTASLQVQWQRADLPGQNWQLVADFWQPGATLRAACETETSSLSSWPTYLHDNARTGYNPHESVLTPPLSLNWHFKPVGQQMNDTMPVVSGNGYVYAVFVNSSLSTLYALDQRSGAVVWSATVSGRALLDSAPAVADGFVYVSIENPADPADSNLYAFTAVSGDLAWQKPFAAGLSSSPVVAGDWVYALDDMGRVHALDRLNGATIWVTEPIAGYEGHYANNPVIINEAFVFFAYPSGPIIAIDKQNGQQLWSRPIELDTFLWDLVGDVANNQVFALGNHPQPNSITALDATTGIVNWFYVFAFGDVTTPALADGNMYLIHNRDATYSAYDLFVFDAGQGQLTGQVSIATPPLAGGHSFIAIANHTLYAVASSSGSLGEVRALDMTTGALLWNIISAGDRPIAPANGQLFVVGADYGLWVYQPAP